MDYMQVNSDILSACQNGNYSELKKLIACRNVISNGGNEKVEYCDNYRRPLLAAIQSNSLKCLRLLLEHIVSYGSTKNSNKTTLFNVIINEHSWMLLESIKLKHYDITKYLLDYDIKVDIKDREGRASISILAEVGNAEILSLFITKKADLSARDNQRKTPAMYAAEAGHLNVLKLLYRAGVDLHLTMPYQHCVNRLQLTQSAMHFAVMQGHEECLHYLMCVKKDWNYSDVLGFKVAEPNEESKRNCLKMLLRSCRKNLKKDEFRMGMAHALILAAQQGWTKCLQVLLSGPCACVDEKIVITNKSQPLKVLSLHFTALTEAVKAKHTECAEMLLKFGASVNLQDEHLATPLWYAAESGNVTLTTQLLKHKADPTLKNFMQETPLFAAVRRGHSQCLTELLKNPKLKTLIDQPNVRHKTPLMEAVFHSKVKCIQTLLDLGSDVNFRKGQALSLAIRMGNSCCIPVLMARGAEPHLCDAYMLAVSEKDRVDCLKMLLSHSKGNHMLLSLESIAINVSGSKTGQTARQKNKTISFQSEVKENFANKILNRCIYFGILDEELLELLLRFNAEINYRSCDRFAYVYKYQKKRDLSDRDILNVTNLELALVSGSMTRLLLSRNVDVTHMPLKSSCICEDLYELNVSDESVEIPQYVMKKYLIRAALVAAGCRVCKPGWLGMVFKEFGDMLKPKEGVLALKQISRRKIRKLLLGVRKGNLYCYVPELPVPTPIKAYLLYNISLNDL